MNVTHAIELTKLENGELQAVAILIDGKQTVSGFTNDKKEQAFDNTESCLAWIAEQLSWQKPVTKTSEQLQKEALLEQLGTLVDSAPQEDKGTLIQTFKTFLTEKEGQ